MVFLRRALIVLTLAYWAVLLTLTHLPTVPIVGREVSDKLAHGLGYGMLMGLLYLALWVLRPKQRWLAWVALAGVLAYGAVDEWTQPWSGRDCELRDWIADATGAIGAMVMLMIVRWILERRHTAVTMAACGGQAQ